MKGALLTFEWPPIDGGISRLCHEIFKNAKSAGLDLEVVSQTGAKPKLISRRPLREMSCAAHLITNKYDYCISGIWYPEGFIAQNTFRGPKVVLAHGLELMPRTHPLKERLWKLMREQTLNSADLVIANSNYTRKLVKRICPAANVIGIPLGVDENKFAPLAAVKSEEAKFKLLTVSRVVKYKGIETVFNAIAALPEKTRKNIEYQIGGKGPDREYFEGRAKDMGLEAQIKWLGFIDDEKLPTIYSEADLYVMMTQENDREVEGFGLSFLEAQSCGLPVIGSRTGGIPDAIDDGNGGWLLDAEDHLGLSKKIQHLIDSPSELSSAAQSARQRVMQSATWTHYAKKLAQAFAEHKIL